MAENTTTKKDDINKIKAERIKTALAALRVCGKTITSHTAETLYDELALMATFAPLWAKDPYNKLFLKQLAFTLIVPGGKASKAAEAVKILESDTDWFSGIRYLQSNVFGTQTVLPQTVVDKLVPLMRFPKQKTLRLERAFRRYHNLVLQLSNTDLSDTIAVHKLLMKTVKGFGPKAAAHFMRNTGLQTLDSTFIPIVDTHVMKFVRAAFPNALITIKRTPMNMPRVPTTQAEQWLKATPKIYGEMYAEYCENNNANPLLLDAYLWCAYSNTTVPESIDFGGLK